MNKGIKNDNGKPQITLIPKDAIWGMANAFGYGAGKYGRHNFRAGIAFSRLADAAQRHLTAYMEGENNDPESGLSHLDHAMASLAMLKFMDVNRKEMDDRYVLEKKELPEKYDHADDALYLSAKKIQERGR